MLATTCCTLGSRRCTRARAASTHLAYKSDDLDGHGLVMTFALPSSRLVVFFSVDISVKLLSLLAVVMCFVCFVLLTPREEFVVT